MDPRLLSFHLLHLAFVAILEYFDLSKATQVSGASPQRTYGSNGQDGAALPAAAKEAELGDYSDAMLEMELDRRRRRRGGVASAENGYENGACALPSAGGNDECGSGEGSTCLPCYEIA